MKIWPHSKFVAIILLKFVNSFPTYDEINDLIRASETDFRTSVNYSGEMSKWRQNLESANFEIGGSSSKQNPKYQCTEGGCDKYYAHSSALRKHQNEWHGRQVIHRRVESACDLTCEKCKNTFTCRSKLTRHLKAKHREIFRKDKKCDLCSNTRETQYERCRHLQESRPIIYKCDVPGCHEIYANSSGLKRHQNTFHVRQLEFEWISTSKNMQAAFRGKAVEEESVIPDLNVPLPLEDSEQNRYCEDCNVTFMNTTAMKIHGKIYHPGKKMLRCGINRCAKIYADESALQKHQNKYHGRKNKRYKDLEGESIIPDLNNPLRPEDLVPSYLERYCDECKIIFKNKNVMKIHGKVYHPGKKMFRCLIERCSKIYTDESALYRHQNKYHGRKNKYGYRRQSAKVNAGLSNWILAGKR